MKIFNLKKSQVFISFFALAGVLAAFPLSGYSEDKGSNVTVQTTDATSSAAATAHSFEELETVLQKMEKELRDKMNRTIEVWGEGDQKSRDPFFEPDLDLKETPELYIVKVDLPGMKKEQIQVEGTERTITVSGEREIETKETKVDGYHRKERNFGAFKRSLALPERIQPDKTVAEYKDGVLTVTMTKVIPGQSGNEPVKVSIS